MSSWDPLSAAGLIPLLTVRVGAALRLAPFLAGRSLPLLPWAGISVAVAAVLAPSSGPLPDAGIGSALWIALALKELFVGLTIGALIRIAFFVLQAIGDLAGLSMVSMSGAADDEITGGSALTGAFTLLGIGIFFLMDGHHGLIAGLAGTLRCIPPGAMPAVQDLSAAGARVAVGLFSSAMATGVLVSAPVFVAGIGADLAIGLVHRLAPGLAPPLGAQAVRAAVVQISVIAVLGVAISIALEFLTNAMSRTDLCALP